MKSMAVKCNDRNLYTDWGTVVSWNDIFELNVSRVDAINHTVTILEFVCQNGEFIEINFDEPGFDELRLGLADYLPVPIDWYDRVESILPGESLTLFTRIP